MADCNRDHMSVPTEEGRKEGRKEGRRE